MRLGDPDQQRHLVHLDASRGEGCVPGAQEGSGVVNQRVRIHRNCHAPNCGVYGEVEIELVPHGRLYKEYWTCPEGHRHSQDVWHHDS